MTLGPASQDKPLSLISSPPDNEQGWKGIITILGLTFTRHKVGHMHHLTEASQEPYEWTLSSPVFRYTNRGLERLSNKPTVMEPVSGRVRIEI